MKAISTFSCDKCGESFSVSIDVSDELIEQKIIRDSILLAECGNRLDFVNHMNEHVLLEKIENELY